KYEKHAPFPVASRLAFTVLRRSKARAGSSFRNVIKTAVLTVSDPGDLRRERNGATSRKPRLRWRSCQRPIVAFQKPSTVHGVPKATHTRSATVSGVHPPAERIAPAQKSNNIQVATFNTRKVNRRALSVAIACKPAGVVRLGPSATSPGTSSDTASRSTSTVMTGSVLRNE